MKQRRNMTLSPNPIVWITDDDEDDRDLAREAFGEHGMEKCLHFMNDGKALIDRLEGIGPTAQNSADWPSLILLDLNMPRMNGYEALDLIKKNEVLRQIPVAVFTTSKAIEDMRRSYSLGANSYITKPSSYKELVDAVGLISDYWLGLCKREFND